VWISHINGLRIQFSETALAPASKDTKWLQSATTGTKTPWRGKKNDHESEGEKPTIILRIKRFMCHQELTSIALKPEKTSISTLSWLWYNYFYIVTCFFTNFIGNDTYNNAAKIIFYDRIATLIKQSAKKFPILQRATTQLG